MGDGPPTDGWISLHRKIREHPYWQDPERFRVWVDLLLMAAWRPHRKMVGTRQVRIERGEFLASEPFLAKRWDWSRGKVRRFLSNAEKEGEIEPGDKTIDGTVYLIVKYDDYQPDRPSNGTGNGTATEQAPDTREEGSIRKETTTWPQPSNAVGGNYPPEFEEAWSAYPRRKNGNKKEAYRGWLASIRNGAEPPQILAGVTAYARKCEVEGTHPQFIKRPETFFGRGDHWKTDWTPESDNRPVKHSDPNKKSHRELWEEYHANNPDA